MCSKTCKSCNKCADVCDCRNHLSKCDTLPCVEKVSTDCVYYKFGDQATMSKLLCVLGVSNNTNLTTILEKLEEKLCPLFRIKTDSCARKLLGLAPTSDIITITKKILPYLCNIGKVKVTESDTLPGYLNDKIIVGNCIFKTVITDSLGNQQLKLELDYDCIKAQLPCCGNSMPVTPTSPSAPTSPPTNPVAPPPVNYVNYNMINCTTGVVDRAQMNIVGLVNGTVVKVTDGSCYTIIGASNTTTANQISSVHSSCSSCSGAVTPVAPIAPIAPIIPSTPSTPVTPTVCVPISSSDIVSPTVIPTNTSCVCPTVSNIIGNSTVLSGSTQPYSVNLTGNQAVTHVWSISGGTISSGQGATTVTAVWGAQGTGTLIYTALCGVNVCSQKIVSVTVSTAPTVTPVTPTPCNCYCYRLWASNPNEEATFTVTYCDNSTSTFTVPIGGVSSQICLKAVSPISNGYTTTCTTVCCSI